MLELGQEGSPTSNIVSGRNYKQTIISMRADASAAFVFPIDIVGCVKSEPNALALSHLKKKP